MKTAHRCCSQQVPIEVDLVEAIDRRRFLWNWGGGLGGIALAHLLGHSGLLADTSYLKPRPELNGGLHHRAKAEGLRSRAAYKLDELQKEWKLLRSGLRVFDLGLDLSEG